MAAYYNEIDPYAAQWLRNLIEAGHIAPGIVDERSIEDVFPSDLRGFAQCHFFAGIGVWSYALRNAGWSDDRPVWTGSCPCQPFSQAGEGAGFDDERHLWPHWHHLVKECKPSVIVGEQVANKDADPWLDLVHTDLEALGYAFGAVAFPSASVGAPHIRDRTYWMANANDTRPQGRRGMLERATECVAGASGLVDGLAHASGIRLPARAGHGAARHGDAKQRPCHDGFTGGLANTTCGVNLAGIAQPDQRPMAPSNGALQAERGSAGPVNGLWRDADWLFCRDGKWRPVEPGTFPLAHGAPARMGRLRAYGNAINAQAAKVWIEAVMEAA